MKGISLNTASVRHENEHPGYLSIDIDSLIEIASRKI
jgi:hypothetical protein